MAADTKIAWATSTFNPWLGCTKVASGCTNCYAADMAGRLGVKWGPNGTRRRTAESTWKQVERWNRAAACCCRKEPGDHEHEAGCPQRDPPRVFFSLGDPFEDWVGPIVNASGQTLHKDPNSGRYYGDGLVRIGRSAARMADVRRDAFAVIDRCQNLTFILATKRPQNIRRMWPLLWGGFADGSKTRGHDRSNVWLLYSASDQASLDTGLPHLLACRDLSPVLGLSLEPLLGPIDLSAYIGYNPVHETNIRNRDVRLSSSSERRPGDSEGRISLANCAGTRKPMEQEDIVASDSSTSSGRNHVGRIPASQSHARQQTGNDRGASTGLSALPWTDSTWSDGQPQERDQTRQSSRQPGTSDIRGAGSSREEDARAQVENRQPERRGKRHGEANGGSSSGNSPETFGRGVAEVDSRGLRNLGSNGVQDSPWGSVGARPFVIVGGESGPKHRPMEISWLESIADQCAAAGVPLFVKQDCGRKPGQQGQIPDDLWTRKEFPKP